MGRLRRLSGAALALALVGCGTTRASSPVTVTASRTVTVPASPWTPTATTLPTGSQDGSLHRFGEEVSVGNEVIRVATPARARFPKWVSCPRDGVKVVVTFHNTGTSPWPSHRGTLFTGMWDGVRACDASEILGHDLDPIQPGGTRTIIRLYSLGRTAGPFTLEMELDPPDGSLYWTNDEAALSAVGK